MGTGSYPPSTPARHRMRMIPSCSSLDWPSGYTSVSFAVVKKAVVGVSLSRGKGSLRRRVQEEEEEEEEGKQTVCSEDVSGRDTSTYLCSKVGVVHVGG